MSEFEKVTTLISYLQTLTEVSKCDVQVYEEIRRTVKKLDQLLNN